MVVIDAHALVALLRCCGRCVELRACGCFFVAPSSLRRAAVAPAALRRTPTRRPLLGGAALRRAPRRCCSAQLSSFDRSIRSDQTRRRRRRLAPAHPPAASPHAAAAALARTPLAQHGRHEGQPRTPRATHCAAATRQRGRATRAIEDPAGCGCSARDHHTIGALRNHPAAPQFSAMTRVATPLLTRAML